MTCVCIAARVCAPQPQIIYIFKSLSSSLCTAKTKRGRCQWLIQRLFIRTIHLATNLPAKLPHKDATVLKKTRHQRCRCLGGTFDIHSNCSYYTFLYSNHKAICNQLKPISADHNPTGRVYNVQYCPCILNTSEIASIACLHNFSGPALLSCSEILTYQVLGSQLWIALPLKNSRSPATAMINREGANCAITRVLSFV